MKFSKPKSESLNTIITRTVIPKFKKGDLAKGIKNGNFLFDKIVRIIDNNMAGLCTINYNNKNIHFINQDILIKIDNNSYDKETL